MVLHSEQHPKENNRIIWSVSTPLSFLLRHRYVHKECTHLLTKNHTVYYS